MGGVVPDCVRGGCDSVPFFLTPHTGEWVPTPTDLVHPSEHVKGVVLGDEFLWGGGGGQRDLRGTGHDEGDTLCRRLSVGFRL